ncbi:MAG: outer membrane lipoprotein carrier protein LolA [Gemmatimonadetes bacterium]|nr:outer membrane lipoprotein carrier protein LolA [Gemmatimonadota bacterium]MDA1104235.1 outer membrane lipoprotein carrier protein LolA [Gemmatimonadota bacterium]
MTRSLVVTLALSLAALPKAAEGQNRGLEILERASDRYEAVQTLCADFTQHLLVPLLGNERTGTGRLCQGRPNLFAMRFTDPAGDLIVVDGDFAWIYFPSNDARTVLKTSADRSAGGRDFHREFLSDPATKYEVAYVRSEVVVGRETHRINMIPKGPASYRTATVWLDVAEPVLRQLRLEEENGNVRTITLTNVDFASDPGGDWFSFTPPLGALVMVR